MPRTAAAVRSVSPAPSTVNLPKTFEQALKAGWTPSHELTGLSLDQRERRGKLTLKHKGCAKRVSVSYVGTTSGYRFGTPQFVS
ncbi:MAG: hypothetical protein WBC04_18415 [Candidatus Acidiferrales bacterium]